MRIPRRRYLLSAATALAAGAVLVGCQQSSPPPTAEAPSEEPSLAAATIPPSAEATAVAAAPMVRTTENRMYFPTGEESSSVLLLERTGPAQVRLNKEYTYQIKVTNLTNSSLQGVKVEETMPGSFTVTKASQTEAAAAGGATTAGGGATTAGGATAAGGTAAGAGAADHGGMAMGPHTYMIGELGPKESKTITVTGTPTKAGELSSCMSVSYSPSLCTTAMVTNPELKITKEAVGSATGDMCEDQILRYSLTNAGTGDLSGVRVEDPLPEGLTAPDGSRRISFNVGSLAQGQTRTFEVKVKPAHGGQFASAATASADDGVTAKSDATPLAVKAPKLQVALTSPPKGYIGDQVKYEVTVKNVGDAPARSPMVRVDPAGEALEGAQPAAATGGAEVGELAPGASKTITVPLSARAEGDLNVKAVATDPCAAQAMASGKTVIASTPPALLLSTVDEHDPVRVGENVTYTITVLNQSAVPDRNIRVVVTIPENEQYVSSSGITEGQVAGKKITFAPVTTLNGKQSAVWTVTVKALKPADVKFRSDMSSESFPDAATKIEPTRLY